jgi:PHD/YefM family antitoxin component YafN of YafNO toxin-antitoxin module
MAKTTTIDLKDIRSVTDFQRNAKTHVTRLRRTKAPMVLTVNGSAAVVVQDAATYQQLIDRMDKLEAEQYFIDAVNEGLRAKAEGRTRPLAQLSKR